MNIYAEPGQSFQQIGGDCPEGWIEMSEERPGEEHVAGLDGAWVLPPPPVPQSVSRYQGREAMHLTEIGERSLFDVAEELILDPETPAYYKRAWDELQQFERDSAMLVAIAQTLGLTDEQLDDLFRLAATLKA